MATAQRFAQHDAPGEAQPHAPVEVEGVLRGGLELGELWRIKFSKMLGNKLYDGE